MKTRKFDKMIDQFIRNNKKYSRTDLCYSVVPKKQHFIQVSPETAMAGLKVGEDYNNLDATSPVIYGPALLIVHHKTDTLVGVFPL